MDRPRRVWMPWYSRESYDEIRAAMADGDRFPASYGAWLISAEQVEGEVRRSGVEVVRAMLDPAEFLAWCTALDLAPNAAARSRFANEAEGPDA